MESYIRTQPISNWPNWIGEEGKITQTAFYHPRILKSLTRIDSYRNS